MNWFIKSVMKLIIGLPTLAGLTFWLTPPWYGALGMIVGMVVHLYIEAQ